MCLLLLAYLLFQTNLLLLAFLLLVLVCDVPGISAFASVPSVAIIPAATSVPFAVDFSNVPGTTAVNSVFSVVHSVPGFSGFSTVVGIMFVVFPDVASVPMF